MAGHVHPHRDRADELGPRRLVDVARRRGPGAAWRARRLDPARRAPSVGDQLRVETEKDIDGIRVLVGRPGQGEGGPLRRARAAAERRSRSSRSIQQRAPRSGRDDGPRRPRRDRPGRRRARRPAPRASRPCPTRRRAPRGRPAATVPAAAAAAAGRRPRAPRPATGATGRRGPPASAAALHAAARGAAAPEAEAPAARQAAPHRGARGRCPRSSGRSPSWPCRASPPCASGCARTTPGCGPRASRRCRRPPCCGWPRS